MPIEHSYGIIPFRKQEDQWEVLLVHHHAGHWSFPKGHADAGESPRETADRELVEETGLRVQTLLFPSSLMEEYVYTRDRQTFHKKVLYFVALVEGILSIQEEELQEAQWFSLADAQKKLTFSEGRTLLSRAVVLL